MQKIKKITIISFLSLLFSFCYSNNGICADCKNPTGKMKFTSDILWEGIYPVRISGITTKSGPLVNDIPNMSTNATMCTCPMPPPIFTRVGLPLDMWEPARLIDSVKEAWCFPMIEKQFFKKGWWGSGTTIDNQAPANPAKTTFLQAHYYIFPVWAIMEIAIDIMCLEPSGFDLAMVSEINPLWYNDMLANVIYPESVLFDGVNMQFFSLATDAVTSMLGFSNSITFWTLGSHVMMYPVTGNINSSKAEEAHAAAAARNIFFMGRIFLICDPALWYCFCLPTPIIVKHNYRLQVAKPNKSLNVMPMGQTGFLWSAGINPPTMDGNFLWVLFRRRGCCML